MRRHLLIAAAAVSLGASMATPPAATAHRVRCQPPSGAKTLLLSSQARVYKRRGRTELCVLRTGRRVGLGDDARANTFPDAVDTYGHRLSRRYLAYVLDIGGRQPETLIRLYSLRTGRRVKSYAAQQRDPAAVVSDASHRVTDLEVTSRGELAWIARNPSSSNPVVEVHAADHRGERVLEASAQVEEGSLAVEGSRLYWTSGGMPQSAQLSG